MMRSAEYGIILYFHRRNDKMIKGNLIIKPKRFTNF